MHHDISVSDMELGSGSYSVVGSTEVEMEDVLLGGEIEIWGK